MVDYGLRKSERRAWKLTGLVILAILAGLSGFPCMAQADDAQIQQRTRQQQATVEVVRQLIADVLDIQLQQFTDNGLNTLPMFSDIQLMRTNLDKVTEEEMRKIIDLLTQAQRDSDEQPQLLGQARSKAREVVAVLMAERERLRQRLKVAHLQAQLKQVIEQQQRVQSETEHVHTTARGQRDQATLAALEGQRDTHTLFEQLTESLETVQQWDSKEGKAAAEGSRQLRENNVEQLFRGAESDLAKGDIDGANQNQGDIVEELSAVLEKIEAAQGLKPLDPASTLEKVRGLLQEQKTLADETRNADAQDQNTLDQLSKKQNDIHQQLGEVESPVAQVAGGEQLLKQAQAAAMQAESKLFEGARDAALEQQQEVIGNLNQLEDLLEAAESMPAPSEATDSLASQVDELQQLGKNLDKLAEQQDQVLADAAAAPQAAQEVQQNVADGLAQEAQRTPLPQETQQAVQDAAELAEQAAQTMKNQSPQSSSARSEAATGVQQAIQAAQAQAAAQLQAARSAMQQANAQAGAQATASGQPSPNATQSDSQSVTSASRRSSPRQSNQELTDSQAVSSRRIVGDAQRINDQRDLVGGRSYADSPWFARLPPELREAIRMRGRRQPPRGYEDRLRRYFESVDK